MSRTYQKPLQIVASLSLAMAGLALCDVTLFAEARRWSDSSGNFKIAAELVEVKDNAVLLRKSDGKTISVPIDRLSKADQEFVHNSQKKSAVTSPASPVKVGDLQTRLPRVPIGPIDASAPWRKSYDALLENIKTQKEDNGEWKIDWGDAGELGAWYERCRVINPTVLKAMQNVEQLRQILKTLGPLEQERDRAAERLKGVVWTAVARRISVSANVSSQFDLPPFPEPLHVSFWVEKDDAPNWSQVSKGDRVRFACRFASDAMSEEPGIDVHMTFQQVVKP